MISNSDVCPHARVPYGVVVEEMQHLLGLGSGRDDIQTCRQRVGMFGISGELATMPIAVLSGGQKARVQFARVCAPQPHVLVLDEPTNHLGTQRLKLAYQSCAALQLASVSVVSLLVVMVVLPVYADLESIRSLADAVTKFEGAVVIVSHDEQLLSLACSQLWHCDGEGGVTQLHYGFDEYKERLRTGKRLDKK